MKKIVQIMIAIVAIIVIILLCIILTNPEEELITISSQEELMEIYEERDNSIILNFLTLPFSMTMPGVHMPRMAEGILSQSNTTSNRTQSSKTTTGVNPADFDASKSSAASTEIGSATTSKEYSTTNIQVENVDEADITKTDGNYLYSISEKNVIITEAKEPTQMKILAKITPQNSFMIPEDLILYKDKLVVIYTKLTTNVSSYYRNVDNDTTIVSIYDISNKEKPKEVKNYELMQPYYTSRAIEGKLYIIASGDLKRDNDKIITAYKEDDKTIDPGFSGIKRIKNLKTNKQTILSMLDLNNIKSNVKVNSYLMDVTNAYVSEQNIYLLNEKYNYQDTTPEISSIFGWRGILGAFQEKEYEEDYYEAKTQIYKYKLLEDGSIKFDSKAEEKGKTINQFSIDEYEGNLRIALYHNKGSRVVIYNKEMRKIGETQNLAEGEKMYSSRFMGEKAYLVTYQTVDPLFVIDLSNPTNPRVLGELKIPGYSTYLHPYDENHIIGIGMQTEEKINRNANGKVTSTTAVITGMKMALFDVTDVNNPVQISDTIIGDKRTTSSILTNHKALLFSKEKQLLAIPVNNYKEDFEIENTSDEYDDMIDYYKSYDEQYIAEGYLVYHINLEEGFKLKGMITHNKSNLNEKYSYYDRYNSKMLRGLYIEDDLYTISEDYIKVNKLENLEEIKEINIKEDTNGK